MEMGVRRTGYGALGRPAVTIRLMRRWCLFAALFLALTGCKATPRIAGLVTGGAVGVATGSPALGFAVGVATDAAAHAGIRYYGRIRHRAEQDAIAEAAGPLDAGQRAPWKIEHDIPIGNRNGELQVIRVMDTKLATCKEVAFSVDEDEAEEDTPDRAWYLATICRQTDRWRWSTAEPAVERWGFLQ